jgi:NitT/TauT family transport system permease protein
VLVGLAMLAAWQAASSLTASPWFPPPVQVGARLAHWIVTDLYIHVAVTLTEMVIGLALGAAFGIAAGLLLGRSPVLAGILRPVIVAFYSVPLIAVAPLFIMFFGLYMMPKIVLIAIVVFFLLFFNTFAGVTSIDHDLIQSLQLMGASRIEEFRKVVAPGCMVWIVSGFKTALPYSLVAATTGEMLAARRGIGFLIAKAASQVDLAGMYAALLVLMVLGLVLSRLATRLDRWLLRWRPDSV